MCMKTEYEILEKINELKLQDKTEVIDILRWVLEESSLIESVNGHSFKLGNNKTLEFGVKGGEIY